MTYSFKSLKKDSLDKKIITYSEFMSLYNDIQPTYIENKIIQAHEEYINTINKINSDIFGADDIISNFDDIINIGSSYRNEIRTLESEYKKIRYGKKFIKIHFSNTVQSFQDNIILFLSSMIDYKDFEYTMYTSRVLLSEQEYCKLKIQTRI